MNGAIRCGAAIATTSLPSRQRPSPCPFSPAALTPEKQAGGGDGSGPALLAASSPTPRTLAPGPASRAAFLPRSPTSRVPTATR